MTETTKTHFQIPGSKGRIMMADLHWPRATDPTHLILYAHGINGFKDWGGTDLLSETFARNGVAFLKFNFSHNGTTPARPEEFADLEAYGQDNCSLRQRDLQHCLDFIATQDSLARLPLTIIGHSRGGVDALLFASSTKGIAQLITWSAPHHAQTPWQNWDSGKMKTWRETGVQFLTNGRTGQEMPLYYQLYEDYRQNRNRLDVEKAARNLQQPWLILHGSEDESVFVKSAYELKSWQPAAEVAIIDGAGHTYGRSHPWGPQDLPAHSVELVQKSIDFILGQ